MKHPERHPALREMHGQLRDVRVWAALGAVALVLTIIAPFGTDEGFRFAPRLVYWGIVAPLTYFAASGVAGWVAHHLDPLGLPRVGVAALAGAVAGLVVVGIVLLVNAAALGHPVSDPARLWPLAANVIPIVVIITVALTLIETGSEPVAAPLPPSGPPRILQRLPVSKRGRLLALSVEDHYVRVRTDLGTDMVLMRLGDAMAETGAIAGVQVHRSHWVALDAVQRVERTGAKAVITLIDGHTIPASRSYIPVLKEAGLLPG